MKILAGIHQPDAGEIRLNGKTTHFAHPSQAMSAGVSLIHQELNLAENLSVQDNLFLGREIVRMGVARWLDRTTMQSSGRLLLERVGLSPTLLPRRVDSLSIGQKQLVEIARALAADAKILIMDEPTSSLTPRETDRLYQVIDTLKAASVAVVYISHRLAEVKRCADRAIVLRDGRLVGQLSKADISHDRLVRLMVGRELNTFFPRRHSLGDGRIIMEINELRTKDHPEPLHLQLRAGEILGLAGLVGAGRTELAEALFGIRPIVSGRLRLDGQPLTIHSPADAIRAGLLLVPEDRRSQGLVIEQSVGFNLSLPNLKAVSSWWGVDQRRENRLNNETIKRLNIRPAHPRQRVALLSGGNQQKVVIGKWLMRRPKVLILDEPTRGVDVAAKAEIYALIDDLAAQGVAVAMITSDMEELLAMSDRVLVMHEGRIAGELSRTQLSEDAVLNLATGYKSIEAKILSQVSPR